MSCVSCEALKAKGKRCWRCRGFDTEFRDDPTQVVAKVMAAIDVCFPAHAGHPKVELPVTTLSREFVCLCGSKLVLVPDLATAGWKAAP